jgi:predicted nucleic acid-binding protein
VIYLDTSALLKLYIYEAGSETVNSLVVAQDDPLPVWELQRVELINALRLKVFWGDIERAEAERQIELFEHRLHRGQYFFPEIDRVELANMFKILSKETPELGCRTTDILHVACAVQLLPESFVSFDSRQRSLAGKAGLTVLPKETALT